jgi:hypothetical protein
MTTSLNINNNIAMWSGPRNISTAMMYAFANRPDCTVWDEPFYAWYLTTTGLDHPMGNQVMADGITDAPAVIAQCTAPRQKLFYQKHMTQHMLGRLDRSWISKIKNAFLIRAPEKVLASYALKRAEVTLADIGFVQQMEIFKQVSDHLGKAPPVVDSDRFLADPGTGLKKLCDGLDIAYLDKMLSWPKGPKPYDGIWAAHWYNAAHQSTSFSTATPKPVNLSASLQKIADKAQPLYEELYRFASG